MTFCRTPPNIPKDILVDTSFVDVASIIHNKFNNFLSICHFVACGNDAKSFFLVYDESNNLINHILHFNRFIIYINEPMLNFMF